MCTLLDYSNIDAVLVSYTITTRDTFPLNLLAVLINKISVNKIDLKFNLKIKIKDRERERQCHKNENLKLRRIMVMRPLKH